MAFTDQGSSTPSNAEDAGMRNGVANTHTRYPKQLGEAGITTDSVLNDKAIIDCFSASGTKGRKASSQITRAWRSSIASSEHGSELTGGVMWILNPRTNLKRGVSNGQRDPN